jgi:regulator of cell morphogenesis and NO signaling
MLRVDQEVVMVITANTQVRDVVVEQPAAIAVLALLGIDYCCGGKHSLEEACSKGNLDVSVVIEELQRQSNSNGAADVDWRAASLKELIAHIVHRHHSFARRHLSLIRELIAKVERRHGAEHPEIYKISEAFAVISAELTHHFSCEENMLFPHIGQLEAAGQPVTQVPFANLQQPVTRMIMDHNQTGDELRTLREAANNYAPPADACTTFRALYRALEELERDLHQHIHLENNILFPRAIRLEREVLHGTSVASARG